MVNVAELGTISKALFSGVWPETTLTWNYKFEYNCITDGRDLYLRANLQRKKVHESFLCPRNMRGLDGGRNDGDGVC